MAKPESTEQIVAATLAALLFAAYMTVPRKPRKLEDPNPGKLPTKTVCDLNEFYPEKISKLKELGIDINTIQFNNNVYEIKRCDTSGKWYYVRIEKLIDSDGTYYYNPQYGEAIGDIYINGSIYQIYFEELALEDSPEAKAPSLTRGRSETSI